MFNGVLNKMVSELANPIHYYLQLDEELIHVNQLLNKTICILHKGFKCLGCGVLTPIFRQGYCKSCFFKLPQTADWVIRPELSKAHLGIEDRDLEYEKKVQLQPHVVYLANTGNVKVGVTRKTQIPTRWIDQGAHQTITVVEVPNRYLAGVTEVALKDYVSDKTNWRKMLKNEIEDLNLRVVREDLEKYLPDEVKSYFVSNAKELYLEFPVLEFPQKVKSLTLDKTPKYQGILKGIKGQYLIFEDDTVLNVRNHEGYIVELSII